MTYSTSPAGYDLIRRFEGCSLKAYKKAGDPWTVGWGITGALPDGRPVVEGLTITQQEADDALEWFVRSVSDPLCRKHFNARTQSEFDALSSFVYNINHSKLEAGRYSLPGLVNPVRRDPEAVISKWIEYKNPGTIFEQGLYRRRLAELCMFFGLPWHFALGAVLKRSGGVIVDMTTPDYVLQLAEEAAEPAARRGHTTEELNARELARLRGEPAPEFDLTIPAKPVPPPPKAKPAPAPVVPVEAPNLDLSRPPKRVEDSTTAKGKSNRDSGVETAAIGTVTTGGVMAMLPYAEKIAAFAERTPPSAIFMSLGAVTAVVVIVGLVRWWYGRMQMYEGRQKAREAKI